MNYCEKCSVAADGDRCPNCGTKKVRIIESEDPVFLIETSVIWSGMVEDMLKTEGVSYEKQSLIGAGIATFIGSLADVLMFYVRYCDLERAKEILIPLTDTQPITEEEYEKYFESEPSGDEQPQ
ncbi:MAG: hypothetical protein RR933_03770 [Oscillospiraceae bacterium]